MSKKIIFYGWVAAGISLFLYSFTQIDLSLTFSRSSIFQIIEKAFQYVGYFNRPLSTVLYLIIIGFLFILYGWTMRMVAKNEIDKGTIWKIIIVLTLILFLSYNAFSYDLFNYIFDAKIITHYHANPYLHKALDYPGDPMLSFMRWTHRTYPYGPFWLVLTVPLSFIGLGFFSLTFYLFKALMVACFIGSVALIERIARKTGMNRSIAIAAFALNPLVLIESLVSSHNDIVMMFFALLAIFMFLEKKYTKSLLWLIVSILIKYATVLTIPAIIAREKLKLNSERFFHILTVSMLVAVILASYRTQFQPWYLLFALPFASFVQNKYFVAIPVFIVSLFALLQYAPFLYLGNWDPPVPSILFALTIGSIAVSFIAVAVFSLIHPKKAS